MSPQEVAEWLGVAPLPPGVQVREAILRGMAEVKVPSTDEEHIAAFRAFLSCAGPAPTRAGRSVLERGERGVTDG